MAALPRMMAGLTSVMNELSRRMAGLLRTMAGLPRTTTDLSRAMARLLRTMAGLPRMMACLLKMTTARQHSDRYPHTTTPNLLLLASHRYSRVYPPMLPLLSNCRCSKLAIFLSRI